ncbi:YqhG family protein [Alicyclobacillus sp.]|uniref:YqhG family protein n=1 Tax=Alicyclobacillus sp. TaxID=61169 RepID=UPI0025B87237|nr:YqhG family protein [Alicyclobacillus sp.]MCL6516177.1 YqhG family protein [Alicyclobacillus sp.]
MPTTPRPLTTPPAPSALPADALPLRSAAERLEFCDRYFTAVGAPIVHRSPGYREYQLPRDVDKELTDRPYYWMWVEKTGQEVPPTILRLAFDDAAAERENPRLREEALREAERRGLTDLQRRFFRAPVAERIHLGCFRLDKIYQSLDRRGRFACVMPRRMAEDAVRVPWLMLNLLVSFRCDMTEQEFWSVGVCLRTGQVIERFLHMLERIEMTVLPNPGDILSSAAISLEAALRRAVEHVERRLDRRPHDWANDATMRWQSELAQVRTYYRSILPDVAEEEHDLVAAEQARKEQELEARMRPRIEVELRQMALVVLAERPQDSPRAGGAPAAAADRLR